MAGTGSGEGVPTETAKFWRYLDKLLTEDPEAYNRYVTKTLEEGKAILKAPNPSYCLKLPIKLKVPVCTYSY